MDNQSEYPINTICLPRILLVSCLKTNRNLLADLLLNQGFSPETVDSLASLDQIIHSADLPPIVIIDISGFDHAILNRCPILSQKNTRYLILSPKQSLRAEHDWLIAGASKILIKPIQLNQFLRDLHILVYLYQQSSIALTI